MIYIGTRFALSSVGNIIQMLIALYEFLIVLRVICSWLKRFDIMGDNRFSYFLIRATEPVLNPIRETLLRISGFGGWDLSPAVAIALGELLQWIVKLIFNL